MQLNCSVSVAAVTSSTPTDICQFLERVSGFITSFPLLSVIPSFPLMFPSASLTITFPVGSAPSIPSHRITSSCSYVPLSVFLHSFLPKPRATVNTFPPNRGNSDGNVSDREECPPVIFQCAHTCATALHLFAMQTVISIFMQLSFHCLFCFNFIHWLMLYNVVRPEIATLHNR